MDSKPRLRYNGRVWRVVHEKRSPLDPSRAGGRWDLGLTDVLYTSLTTEGAIAEVEYYLGLQPVFPSKMRHHSHEIELSLSNVIRIETVAELVTLGVDRDRYRERLYERTGEIGDAAAFLGCDGLIVPSARADSLNLVVFVEGVEPQNIRLIGDAVRVDWQERRRRR